MSDKTSMKTVAQRYALPAFGLLTLGACATDRPITAANVAAQVASFALSEPAFRNSCQQVGTNPLFDDLPASQIRCVSPQEAYIRGNEVLRQRDIQAGTAESFETVSGFNGVPSYLGPKHWSDYIPEPKSDRTLAPESPVESPSEEPPH